MMREVAMRFAMLMSFFVLGAVTTVAMTSCTKNSRLETLETLTISVKATHDGEVAWDATQRKQIIDKATTREEASAGLTAEDAKVDPIEKLYIAALEALLLASHKQSDVTTANAVRAAAEFTQAVTHLRQGP